MKIDEKQCKNNEKPMEKQCKTNENWWKTLQKTMKT